MPPTPQFLFTPFRLDPANARLWCDTQAIALTPKAFAVLLYLVTHADQLVTKDALLETVWSGTTVSEGVLKACIRELRKALGDVAHAPRFIATVYRRGYRFIAPVCPATPAASPGTLAASPFSLSSSPPPQLVGRGGELARLHRCLEQALQGKRQVVFVTGEAGIGKTAVVEAFLTQARAHTPLWIAYGQCLELYGPGEAYLPVLEALGRLCRASGSERLLALLHQHAPTWLAQMPWLLSPADRDALQRELLGATQQRMLREMAEAMEVLTVETPLVLVLEDLHWSDYATVDLLAVLAQRLEPARLLVLGTYRPVEVIVRGHPLKTIKATLQLHGHCVECPLELLSEAAVAAYLTVRCPGSQFPALLARVLHQRTEGNPLFLVSVVEHWLAQGVLVAGQNGWELTVGIADIEDRVPEGLREMLAQQLERLGTDELQVLEGASAMGVEFAIPAVAAALEADVIAVEQQCEALTRQQCVLRAVGTVAWPDGTVAARYAFTHCLHQQVVYQRLGEARRAFLHQRIGTYLEEVYGPQVRDMAAELAMHFAQGRDDSRAVQYLRLAAENATRRYANREALPYCTRALGLVERLPPAEQTATRMAVQGQLGLVRRAMGDMHGAAEDFAALAAYARQQGQAAAEVKALLASASAISWVDRERCRVTIEQAVALSAGLTDKLLQAHARGYWGHWYSRFCGWRQEDAQACVAAIAIARQANERTLLSLHIGRYCYYQCLQSDYRAACHTAEDGAQLALEVGDAFEYLYCRYYQAWALMHLGQWGDMLRVLDTGMQMAEKNGHRLATTLFQLEMAWLHAQVGDFTRTRELCEDGLTQAQEAGHETSQFLSLILLGQAYLGLGDNDRALHCFSAITRRLAREPSAMEWMFQMPLYYGLSTYWLAQRDFRQAQQAAERLQELASQPGERTYLALALQTLATIALAEQKGKQAAVAVSRALAALEEVEAPLAAWRVYETAAQVQQCRGQRAAAAYYGRRAATVIRGLADALSTAVELRQAFLLQPSVQSVLRCARIGA